eukprot:Gb_34771 [translate_table: standard]
MVAEGTMELDFGLARAIPESVTHNVVGIVGHITPEYPHTLKFTDKCHVYSFGVSPVLVIGKQTYDNFFQTIPKASIPQWLRNVLGSGNIMGAIDPTLRGQG